MNKKILIVEDSSTMRRIVTKALIELGVNENGIIAAVDGVDGLKKMDASNGFDLILTDWNMPNMDGLELVNNLRKMPKSDSTPIVMITTEDCKDDVLLALKSGVNNYIVKPFNLETLTRKLEPILSRV